MVLTSDDLDKIKSIVQSTLTEKFLNKIAAKVADIVEAKFEARVTRQEEIVNGLKNQIVELQTKSRDLEKRVEEQEQSSRNLNVRIFGLPHSHSVDLRKDVVQLINDKLKVNVRMEDVKRCFRVSAKNHADKPPAVMVRFANDTVKSAVIANRKHLKSENIRVKEDLTKFRLTLLDAAIKRFTYRNAWCLKGNIYVRHNNGVHRVSDMCDLGNIGNH